jgi:hypothetical protein
MNFAGNEHLKAKHQKGGEASKASVTEKKIIFHRI